jgi:hypothetical protein
MALPKLESTISRANTTIDRLSSYKTQSANLEAKYQNFISEMIMLRLFSVFEDSVADIAFKITAGATYINGSQPTLNVKANNTTSARALLLSHGRSNSIRNLQWTKAKFIRESVEYVFSPNETFISRVQQHGGIIEEMRKVRNVIAHNSASAKSDYKTLVRTTYGANLNIKVGAFLTSTKRTSIPNIEKYLRSTKVVLYEIASGT